MNASKFIRIILIPAAVFQSVIFGGAYGTGRETAEYISSNGPIGGMLSLALIALGFGVILSLSFELARTAKVYEYRGFLKLLIGRAWVLFEILFIIGLLICLAVNGSAAGSILSDRYGIPSILGIVLLFSAVIILNYFGRNILEKSMAICMLALLTVLLIFFVLTVSQSYDAIAAAFTSEQPSYGSWLKKGSQFTLYTVSVIPVLLYCSRDIGSRREAIISGFTAGVLGVVPALVFHVTFMASYPAILDEALPTYWMIGQLASPWLMVTYLVILFAMIIQTVAGLLQGVNERLDSWHIELRGRPCGSAMHASVATATLLVGLLLANFGITALVAKGYGNIAWGHLIVYVIPLFTIGLYKIIKAGRS